MHMALYIRVGSHTIQTKNDGTISVSLLRQDGTWGLPNPHLPLAVTNCNLEPEHFGHRVDRDQRHNHSRPSHIRRQSSRSLAKVLHPLELLNTKKWRTFQLTLDLTGKAGTPANIVTLLQSLNASLYRAKGLAPYVPLFVTKMARGRNSKTSSTNSRSSG